MTGAATGVVIGRGIGALTGVGNGSDFTGGATGLLTGGGIGAAIGGFSSHGEPSALDRSMPNSSSKHILSQT